MYSSDVYSLAREDFANCVTSLPRNTRIYPLAERWFLFPWVNISFKSDGVVEFETRHHQFTPWYRNLWSGIARIEEVKKSYKFEPDVAWGVRDRNQWLFKNATDNSIHYWNPRKSGMRLFLENHRWFIEIDDNYPNVPHGHALGYFRRNEFWGCAQLEGTERTLAGGRVVLYGNNGLQPSLQVDGRYYEWWDKIYVDSPGFSAVSQKDDSRLFLTVGNYETIIELYFGCFLVPGPSITTIEGWIWCEVLPYFVPNE